MRVFLAHWLTILAAWTLVIKFIFPLVYDSQYGHSVGSHIYWDFWWVAHVVLAWLLLRWRSISWPAGMVISVLEIGIITVKFWLFLRAPDWNLWQTNWFINKIFVLSCFVVLLIYLMINRQRLRERLPSGVQSPEG